MAESRIARLKRIADKIPTTRQAAVGGTGYLDDRFTPAAPLMKGVDRYERTFITLCLRYAGQDDREHEERRGIITIFQRYTDGSGDVVTQASNSRLAPTLFFHGAATDEDMVLLEELVDKGEMERTESDRAGGPLHTYYCIVAPEVALAAEAPVERFSILKELQDT